MQFVPLVDREALERRQRQLREDRQRSQAREGQDGIRLNKYLSQMGVASRREADAWISQGLVMVNGQPAREGQRVLPTDQVMVKGVEIWGQVKKSVLAFYKPQGVVCSRHSETGEPLVGDFIDFPTPLTYAGRLDKDSEGLLLMTNDGDLIDAMMRGAQAHEKEYIVDVNKALEADFLRRLSQGVYLEELGQTTRPCQVEAIGQRRMRIVLTQGLNRQIRRMCKALGYRVEQLRRIRVMNVHLGNMLPGHWRKVEKEELAQLYALAGLDRKE